MNKRAKLYESGTIIDYFAAREERGQIKLTVVLSLSW